MSATAAGLLLIVVGSVVLLLAWPFADRFHIEQRPGDDATWIRFLGLRNDGPSRWLGLVKAVIVGIVFLVVGVYLLLEGFVEPGQGR